LFIFERLFFTDAAQPPTDISSSSAVEIASLRRRRFDIYLASSARQSSFHELSFSPRCHCHYDITPAITPFLRAMPADEPPRHFERRFHFRRRRRCHAIISFSMRQSFLHAIFMTPLLSRHHLRHFLPFPDICFITICFHFISAINNI